MFLFLLGFISMPVMAFFLSWLWFSTARSLNFHDEDDHAIFRHYNRLGQLWCCAAIALTVNNGWYALSVIWPQEFQYMPPLEYGLVYGILIMVTAMITTVFLTKNKD